MNPERAYQAEKPIIKEIGPYVYDQQKFRTITSFNRKEKKFEFFETTYYFFNSSESGGRSEDDIVTIINYFLVGIIDDFKSEIKLEPLLAQSILSNVIDIKNVFMTEKVKDILFDGIRIDCSNISWFCTNFRVKHIQLLRPFGDDLKFSMFHHMNGTRVGPFEVYIGSDERKGDILSYEEKTTLKMWRQNGQCHIIKGTNLQIFPSLAVPVPRIYIFFHELCRSMYFSFDNYRTVHDILSYTYVGKKDPFDVTKTNMCFCKREKIKQQSLSCNFKGTMNLNLCKNFSLIVSYPHFYLGDSKLSQYTQGLTPMRELHESFISLEPKSGIALSFAIRFQYNIYVKRVEEINMLSKISDGMFPILWTEEISQSGPEKIQFFQNVMYILKILNIGKYSSVVLGVLVMLLSVMLVFYHKVRAELKERRNKIVFRHFDKKHKQTRFNTNLYPQLLNKNVNDRFVESSGIRILVLKY
ncbi:sensory neuron membrane protein 2-like [Tenebrio molitor]|uniref:sensory neuron membrane protein 2-like n=1 Tax=Tenebrio molitor TaxID=7067 RepID=UPI0036248946